jgi:phosphoglycerate dehydrogenase-like enzyme
LKENDDAMKSRPELNKIVFSYDPEGDLLETVRSVLPDASVVVAEGDSLIAEVSGAQLVIGGKIGDEALAVANELVWQHVTWAGVENMITPAFIERGVTLTNSRGVSAPNMAEHVVAMMLAFGRAIPFFVKMQQERRRPSSFSAPAQLAGPRPSGSARSAAASSVRGGGLTRLTVSMRS